jgi:hypothetical protein
MAATKVKKASKKRPVHSKVKKAKITKKTKKTVKSPPSKLAKLLNKVKIKSLRVFVSAANLITFSKAWRGFDPEINNANAEFYPLMRTYTAGVNDNF